MIRRARERGGGGRRDGAGTVGEKRKRLESEMCRILQYVVTREDREDSKRNGSSLEPWADFVLSSAQLESWPDCCCRRLFTKTRGFLPQRDVSGSMR